jgi:hypothetical protein
MFILQRRINTILPISRRKKHCPNVRGTPTAVSLTRYCCGVSPTETMVPRANIFIASFGILFVVVAFLASQSRLDSPLDSYGSVCPVCPPNRSISCPIIPSPIQEAVKQPEEDCSWKFDSYIPSEWEASWVNAIDERRLRVCALLVEEADNVIEYLENVINWSNATRKWSKQSVGTKIFSRMIFHNRCTDQYAAQLIEPLVGMLRDPVTICEDNPRIPAWLKTNIPDGPVQSKRFNLFAVNAPYGIGSKNAVTNGTLDLIHSHTLMFGSGGGRKILYDLGANYFASWGSDTSAYSTAYFYLMYAARQISFDRVFAYEYAKLDPHQVWDVVPDELLANGAYTMINHGVLAGEGEKFNPFTAIKNTITAEDHLVFKLDIDTPHIEGALIQQLMQDPNLTALVDEMCFEHHVYIPEMQKYWGVGADSPNTLATSYQYYTDLRNKGIRMHSWP